MARVVNFSEALLIGLHSLVLLAKQSPKPASTKYIASVTGASENTISKVMQRLVKENFIQSSRGPAGGFILARLPVEITFKDIYEAIEGKMETEGCPFNAQHCTFKKCIFENYLNNVSNDIKNFFSGKTLLEYME